MTPCPSLPAQPQEVSTLFSCTFYFTCTLYISPYIPHDTLSITTCTTTAGKYSIFMYILLYMYIVYLSLHTLFSCTFYFTCTLYISPYIPHDTLSITTCTTTAGKYSTCTPAQPQLVSTLFSCTFFCTCTLYISPYIPHDTLSITTCTTTGGKYSIFMYILLYMYIAYLSLHSP